MNTVLIEAAHDLTPGRRVNEAPTPPPPRLSAGPRSLQRRFLTFVVGCAVLFSMAVGIAAYGIGHVRGLTVSRGSLQSMAQAVGKTAAAGAFANDRVLLQELVDGIGRDDLVAGAEVLTMDGKVIAMRWKAGMSPRDGEADHESSITLTLVSPFDASDAVGRLRVHADSGRIGATAAREALTLAALMVGQALLLASLIYLLAARLVSRPIVSLASQLGTMEAGSDQRLPMPPMHRDDEIGVLINGANDLLESNAEALRTERALRARIEAMEAQYRQIFDFSSAGIFVLDAGGRMINGNPTVSKVVGLSLEEMRHLENDMFLNRVFAEPGQVRAMIDEARRKGETVSGDLELVRRGEGTRWVHCLVSVQEPSADPGLARQPGMVEGVIYDITARKSAEGEVQYQADHDALTGLKNRRASLSAIDRHVLTARVERTPLSVLTLDLDGFKKVNDTMGHGAGDEVLRVCAHKMLSVMRRTTDLVGRLGGDEFIIAMPGLAPDDPMLAGVAEALVTSMCEPIVLQDGREARIGVSIGIACLPGHGPDTALLIEAADAALYKVKRNGKNAYAIARAPGDPAIA